MKSSYGNFIQNVEISFETIETLLHPHRANWNVQKIQHFLGILNSILKRVGNLRQLIIRNFAFDLSTCWDSEVADSWSAKREYVRNIAGDSGEEYFQTDYMFVFTRLIADFLSNLNRSHLSKVNFCGMHFSSYEGLQVTTESAATLLFIRFKIARF